MTSQRVSCQQADTGTRLLRNCPIGHFTCLEIDERKAQILGTLTETAEDVRPMLRVVGFGARIAIDASVLQVR